MPTGNAVNLYWVVEGAPQQEAADDAHDALLETLLQELSVS